MKKTKSYVIGCSMKNAKEYFKGQQVLQGMYNGKNAVYVSASYDLDVDLYEMYSANSCNRYLGRFIPASLVNMNDAKGKVLIAK